MPNSLKCRLKNLVRNGLLRERDLKRIIIIPEGEIPKGATHGDVFKKMFNTVFPKTIAIFKVDESNLTMSFCFTQEWWDEPYDAEHYAKVREESEVNNGGNKY